MDVTPISRTKCLRLPFRVTAKPTATALPRRPAAVLCWALLCFSFLGSTLGCTAANALDPSRAAGQHAYRQWRIEEGLPQNTVRAIAQTPDDLLWIATHAGLTRFDGVAFERIEGHEVLESSHVYALVVDDRGHLWIGTNGGGLLRWDGQQFKHFDADRHPGLPSNSILALAEAQGRVWIGTEDGGVAVFEDGDFRSWGTSEGIPTHAVHGLAPTDDGGCWLTSLGSGLFYISPQGEVRSITANEGLPSNMARAVAVDREGHLWVGGHFGLARRDDRGWHHLTEQNAVIGDRISSLRFDRDGNLWIGTLGRGVGRWNGLAFEALTQTAGRQLDIVWNLFEDREGHIWIGTLGGGLVQLFDGPVLPIGEPEGLGARQAVALHQDTDGTLWIATRDSGFRRWRQGEWLPPITVDQGLSHNGSWGLDFGIDGSLWSATFSPSLDRLHTDGRATVLTSADGLGSGRFLAVLADRHGDVWVSTSGGLGRLHDGRITTYTTDDGLVHNQTLCLTEPPPGSSNGRVWIGTNGGFSVWSEQDGFRSFTMKDGLRNDRIWSILPDAEDGAWIGTFGGGLHRLRGGRIDLVLNVSHGLPSNDVTALVDDDRGYLWLATTRGLARLPWEVLDRPADEVLAQPLPVLNLDVRDGMRSAEAYGGQPIGILADDGHLWFATLNGMVRIDPEAVETPPPPRVVIVEALVDGQRLESFTDFELDPDFRLLTVSFSASTLAAPSRIRFRHRLIGLDDTWRDLGSRRRIELPRLPAGDYQFELEASDVQGQFHGESTRFRFQVLPRFTQTRGFYFLAALGLIALGLAAQQWRVRRLRLRETELQQTAEEAIANVRTLRGMLPMCASCKNIRDDEGYWQALETYISDHSEAAFSHGLCPSCSSEYFPELETTDRRQADS